MFPGMFRTRFDQFLEGLQLWELAWTGAVLSPLHAALAGPAQQVKVAIAVPIDDKGIAVMALDRQRLVMDTANHCGIRLSQNRSFSCIPGLDLS